MQLRVLVTGATGQQGGALARLLLNSGHKVVALTRNPNSASAQELKRLGATLAKGNLEDQHSIEQATDGADVVFSMSTPFESGTDTETRQGIAVANAAKSAGVKHLIYTSVPRAYEHTGIPHFDSKEKVENHIKEVGVPYTILGPAFFMDNLLSPWWLPGLKQGVFAIPLSANRKWNVIAVEDIAKFAAHVIENREQFLGRRIDLSGDEITPTQVAETLTTLSGRQIVHYQVPEEQMRKENEDFAIMFDWFERVGMRIDVAALRAEYPQVGWQSFDGWASRQDWSVLGQADAGSAA